MAFTYDYTRCMMTKLLMAVPDRKGGSKVFCDCDKALEIIRKTDNMTPGIKKIVYLVGWQYCGHDDKYPAFFAVNEGIKGREDETALAALLRLMREAEKYDTVVSLHINFTDAYEDSPLYGDYVKEGALIRGRNGKPAPIEKYNGRKCYKISYKEEWNSGLFRARADRLLKMLPIERAGTVHVDNFQCYVNRKPFVSAQEQMYYRDKMIGYLREKGIDITTEFTYREGRGTSLLYGRITRDITPTRYPIALLGKVPANWWVDKMTKAEYFAYYPHALGGGMPKSKWARSLFYGNVHCEDIWQKEEWEKEFVEAFFTVNMPFFFLNSKQRVGFTDKSMKEVAYSDGTRARTDGTIISGGMTVKSGGDVFLPYGDAFCAYSSQGGVLSGRIGASSADICRVTPEGAVRELTANTCEGVLSFRAEAGTAYFVRPKKEKNI